MDTIIYVIKQTDYDDDGAYTRILSARKSKEKAYEIVANLNNKYKLEKEAEVKRYDDWCDDEDDDSDDTDFDYALIHDHREYKVEEVILYD
jgi:hypothetical protein